MKPYDYIPRRFALWLLCLVAPLPELKAGWSVALYNTSGTAVTFVTPNGNLSVQPGASGIMDVSAIACVDTGVTVSGTTYALPNICWYSGTSGGWTYVAGSTHSVYNYYWSGPPAPAQYKGIVPITNGTQARQRYRVDTDGDGDWDDSFELAPGDSMSYEITTDVAPVGPVVVEVETYVGDAQWAFESVTTANLVQTSGSPTPAPETTTQAVAPVDSTSKSSTQVQYNAPTGGGLTESTFKTGTESLRTSEVQSANKVAEAVDRLRLATKDWLGFDSAEPTPASRVGTAETTANAQQTAVAGAVIGTTNSFATRFGTVPAGVAPAPSFWAIPIGAYSLNWDVRTEAHGASWWAWGRSLILWTLWLTFGGWAIHEALGAVRMAALAPQAQSSSTLPGVSSGIALAAGVAICVVIATALAGVLTLALGAASATLFPSATEWQSSGITGTVVYLADLFVPWSVMVGLGVAGAIYKFAVESLAIGSMGFIRAMGV